MTSAKGVTRFCSGMGQGAGVVPALRGQLAGPAAPRSTPSRTSPAFTSPAPSSTIRARRERVGHYDVAIIGSGFGGSVSALRLTEKGYRVAVFEAGERKRPADFPTSNWDLRRYLWFPRLGMRGIQRVVLLPEVMVLAEAGVGGGSLNYANVMYRPPNRFDHDRQWAGITDWEEELAAHYDRASRMLGVEENPEETPSDRVMQGVAERM